MDPGFRRDDIHWGWTVTIYSPSLLNGKRRGRGRFRLLLPAKGVKLTGLELPRVLQ